MTVELHPDEVLKAILAKGNRSDKVEKLQKLHELCSKEYSGSSQGARDLSIANMARIADSHGLFKARTIYNKPSEDYAALIKAWETYNGPKLSSLVKVQRSASEDKYAYLKKIEDPAIRSLCQMAIAERDKLRNELNLLKSTYVAKIDNRPLGAEIVKGSTNVAIIETAAQLTDSERTALTEAIDSKCLAQHKLRLGDTGEIIDERGRFVFKPGFATAIAKVLGRKNTKPALEVKPV
jgi:predicted DNA binding protein